MEQNESEQQEWAHGNQVAAVADACGMRVRIVRRQERRKEVSQARCMKNWNPPTPPGVGIAMPTTVINVSKSAPARGKSLK